MFYQVKKALLWGVTAFAIVVLLSQEAQAQNETDVFRFSQQNSIGTVRTIGLCGAYGALGADLASMSINPAGIGMYRRSDLGATVGVFSNNTNSMFGDVSTDASSSSSAIGNIGLTLTTPSVNPDAPFFTFGFYHQKNAVYNKISNLENADLPSSLLGVFLDAAQGTDNLYLSDGSAYPLTSSLALNADLIDPNSNSSNTYVSTFPTTETVGLSYTVEESGDMRDNQFSIGYTQSEIISLGATITSSKIHYSQTYVHSETPSDPSTDLANWEYIGDLQINGDGLNLKLGAIAHIDWLKLGLAWHSPTKYNLKDRYSNTINSYWKDGGTEHGISQDFEYEYLLKTPSKLIISSAVIVDKYGIISVDYETTDFSKGQLLDSGIYFEGYDYYEENLAVQDSYKRTHEARLGVEGRINKNFRARAGAAYRTSPYTAESGVQATGITSRMSLGSEYRIDNKYIGLAWQKSWSSNDLYVQDPTYQGNPIDQSWSTSFLVIGGGVRF